MTAGGHLTLPSPVLIIVKLASILYQICPINFLEKGAFNALKR